MELGGKNSAIVCEDADLDGAVEGAVDTVGEVFRGSFLNSGQICMATDRILVQESIAEDFTSRLKSAIEESNSQRHPVLISEASKERVVSLLRDALEKGATLITGFDLSTASKEDVSATSMPITLLRNVPSTALAASEEWFAPVASIETFKDTETAIAIANANSSLSSSVFTRDLRKALKIAKQIKTGAVHINGMSIHDDPTMPHGGVGESGWGRFNAREGIEEFLVSKGITWRD
ncbi:inner nuclear membrane protein enriched at telomere/subtelomere region [Ascosphaera pollenicola]|nr:inner nuclear membrane protein enriched at telomere/subtelomere region [Ascosphaera pollenicola]